MYMKKAMEAVIPIAVRALRTNPLPFGHFGPPDRRFRQSSRPGDVSDSSTVGIDARFRRESRIRK